VSRGAVNDEEPCCRCRRQTPPPRIKVTHRGQDVWICLWCLHGLAREWLKACDERGEPATEAVTMKEEIETPTDG
jgi:hypothetical protein